jgi:hypothetical protein
VYTGVEIGANQVGGRILFDWGITTDIDVINVWDITNNGDGTVTYTSTDGIGFANPGFGPVPDGYDMQDGIRGYKMIDGAFPAFNANFDFTIAAPPTANDDSKSTAIDTPVNIDLAANDSAAATTAVPPDPAAFTPAAVPPATLTVDAVSTQGGTLSQPVPADGTVGYTPPAGYTGVDTFTYTLTDDAGRESIPATVTITILLGANNPPIASDTTVTTDEDTPLDIFVDEVASDPDDDPLRFQNYNAVSVNGGTIAEDATGTVLTYTPAQNFNGMDSFNYSVTDGTDDSDVATITVVVEPVNDALECQDVKTSTALDTPLEIDVTNELLSTCNDVDNDPIRLWTVGNPSQPGSTTAYDGANTVTYTPADGFEGYDEFTYTAFDGTDFGTSTVTVAVGNVFGNFTMLDRSGMTFGGTNDIVFTWDGTCYSSVAEAEAGPINMTMGSASNFPFFGFPWTAHDIKVYCPGGPYTVDTCNPVVTPPNCGPLSFTVPADHVGGHILLDWNITKDIDVAIVWNNSTGGSWQNVVTGGDLYQGPSGPTPALDEYYDCISVDADGDGVPGIAMVDGPFRGFRANFNFKTTMNDCHAKDSDNDGIPDHKDNCSDTPNGPLIPDGGGLSPRDTDGDGYGNVCDPDFDNSGNVDFADLAHLKSKFFTANADADLNGDGTVDFADLAILKSMFFGPPGPSGLAP